MTEHSNHYLRGNRLLHPEDMSLFPLFRPSISNATANVTMPPIAAPPTFPPTPLPTLPPTLSPAQALYEQQLAAYYTRRIVVISVCTGLIGILCCLLGFILLPNKIPKTKKQLDKHIAARYATIDAWLITKSVQKHDEDCDHIQEVYGVGKNANTIPSTSVLNGEALLKKLEIPDPKDAKKKKQEEKEEQKESPKSKKQKRQNPLKKAWKLLKRQQKTEAESTQDSPNEPPEVEGENECCNDTDDDIETASNIDSPACSICLESYRVGDQVSWSSGATNCTHTFHHACLREWLLRKSGCPYCREHVLPVDAPSPEELLSNPTLQHRQRPLSKDRIRECAKYRANKSTTSYFCVECGLVHLKKFYKDSVAVDANPAKARHWKRPWTRMAKGQTNVQCHEIEQRPQRSSFYAQDTMDIEWSSSDDDSSDESGELSSHWSEESDSSWESEDDDSESDDESDTDSDDSMVSGHSRSQVDNAEKATATGGENIADASSKEGVGQKEERDMEAQA